jgi:hypothetical protein
MSNSAWLITHQFRTFHHFPELEACLNYQDADFEINSFSGNGSYSLNLHTTTCTCPDFQKKRIQFPERHPARLCKHLRHWFDKSGLAGQTDSLTLAILNSSPWKTWYRIEVPGRPDVYIGRADGNLWLEVVYSLTDNSQYQAIGFNTDQWEWMGFQAPKGLGLILKAIIKQHFAQPKSSRRV